tara:strand:- start:5326 stop:5577 length:252 start_codon:yes stop_codon:yes gene_type:complete
MKDAEKFLKEAHAGVVTVVFEKLHTKEIRIMPCTLNEELSNGNANIVKYEPTSDNFVVWCLDKDAWRSFRASTVKEWYVGDPK